MVYIDNSSVASSQATNNSSLQYTSESTVESRGLTQYSPNPAINEAIPRLRALGVEVMPVAPAQDPYKYPATAKTKAGWSYCLFEPKELEQGRFVPKPKFNGKNPSWLDKAAKPSLVSKWESRQWTEAELKKVFAHPDTRIGHVAISVDGKRRVLDLDRKDFSSASHFERETDSLVSLATYVEQTPGGGYHALIEFTEGDPVKAQGKKQANIGLGDVDYAGELPQFVVCYPTPGYTVLKDGPPLKVRSLNDIGVRFTAKATTKAKATQATSTPTPNKPTPLRGESVPTGVVVQLITKRNQAILQGNGAGNPSGDIASVAKDFFGWVNFAAEYGITLEDPTSHIERLAADMGRLEKLDRILAPIDRASCRPAMEDTPSGKKGCLQKLERIVERQRLLADVGDNAIEVNTQTQKPGEVALQMLFSKDYIRIGDDYAKYVGTHYEIQHPSQIERMINDLFQRAYMVCKTKGGEQYITKPWFTSSACKDAFSVCLRAIPCPSQEMINPPGLNLKNGVLRFEMIDGIPQPQLIPHTPNIVYTYPGAIDYNPEASPEHSDRLLEAVEPEYRPAFLRVLAAALDLGLVTQHKGRMVRALILTGDGNNGKDAIRTILTWIFSGKGVTSCSVEDFHAYDQGRKFGLSPLLGSLLNWSSENNMAISIDKLESLKKVLTGDPLTSERKHQDGVDFTPRCVVILSSNDKSPNLTARAEAIASRFAIVPFKKTFKAKPKGPNELKADSRFKYDSQWVRDEVCPAFLNRLIAEYQAIFTEGIDYEIFEDEMERTRLEANHLLLFANEEGLEVDPLGVVDVPVLWNRLRQWYIDQAILVEQGDREVWQEDVRAGDGWVRGSMQLKKRLQKVFPNIGTSRTNRCNRITGIRFIDPLERALKSGDAELPEADIISCVTMVQDAIRANNPKLLTGFEDLTNSQRATVKGRLSLDEQAFLEKILWDLDNDF